MTIHNMMRYCEHHQGDYAHYAEENCAVCKLMLQVRSLKALQTIQEDKIHALEEDKRTLLKQLGEAYAETIKVRQSLTKAYRAAFDFCREIDGGDDVFAE